MGLFSKKEKKVKREELPKLLELPKLPELPRMEDHDFSTPLHQLPRFPNNSLGSKFSQDTIKEAMTGEKEDEVFDADEFAEDERMMQKPLKKALTKELSFPEKRSSEDFEKASSVVRKAEPVFIRLDKFEEALQIFERAKHQLAEIEKRLAEIKEIKETEERELISWENEIKNIKNKIEKINKDIFSKVG